MENKNENESFIREKFSGNGFSLFEEKLINEEWKQLPLINFDIKTFYSLKKKIESCSLEDLKDISFLKKKFQSYFNNNLVPEQWLSFSKFCIKIFNFSRPSFRLEAKTFFLTYPQIDILDSEDKEGFIELLKKKLLIFDKNIVIEKFVIAKEKHKDINSWHFHVLLFLNKILYVKDSSFFDVQTNTKVYHGNYKGAKNIKALYSYCTKDGDFFETPELKKKKTYTKTKTITFLKEGKIIEGFEELMNDEKNLLNYLKNPELIKKNLEMLSLNFQNSSKKSRFNIENFKFPTDLYNFLVNYSLITFNPLLLIENIFCSGLHEGIFTLLSLNFNVSFYTDEKIENFLDSDIVIYSSKNINFQKFYDILQNEYAKLPHKIFVVNLEFLNWILETKKPFFDLVATENNFIKIIVINKIVWSTIPLNCNKGLEKN